MAHLVFTYGTLLSGCGNHAVIAAGELIGEAITTATYAMVSLGGFPGVIPGGETAIAGELYSVSDATLIHLDRLEGNGHFYTRIERTVTLTDGRMRTAWIYELPESHLDHEAIESGSWREWEATHCAAPMPWEMEPELDEAMCEGCDVNVAVKQVMDLELCRSCARIFAEDEEDDLEDGRVA